MLLHFSRRFRDSRSLAFLMHCSSMPPIAAIKQRRGKHASGLAVSQQQRKAAGHHFATGNAGGHLRLRTGARSRAVCRTMRPSALRLRSPAATAAQVHQVGSAAGRSVTYHALRDDCGTNKLCGTLRNRGPQATQGAFARGISRRPKVIRHQLKHASKPMH